MIVRRHVHPLIVYLFTWRMILWALFTGILAFVLYDVLGLKGVAIPWLPVSLVGTATAFYVGFKNNQSYDRFWEARRVWGSITNISRSFSSMCRAFIGNDFAVNPVPEEKINAEIHALLYRHIGWLYVLRNAMDKPTTWEHHDIASVRQRRVMHKGRESFEVEVRKFLTEEEIAFISTKKNGATHLLDKQTQHIARLYREGLIDSYRHIELQQMITNLFAEQGASERIKNTPFPRQYATSSTIFIIIFIVLLPFGMLDQFSKLGDGMIWLMIPFNLIVTWVFALMEYTGDISENPFEGLLTDVPLRTIIANIEIDIKDMLNEKDLPEKVISRFGTAY